MDAATLHTHAARFLTELQRSPQTISAYRADLRHLQTWLSVHEQALNAASLRQYFAAHPTWAPSIRSRKHTTFERFAHWAMRHD